MREFDAADSDADQVSFLGRAMPPGFAARITSIPLGAELEVEPSEWINALVIVEAGEVELECNRGGREAFGPGSMFCGWDGLRRVRNTGEDTVLLSVVSRQPKP
jgi:hypothetical protein